MRIAVISDIHANLHALEAVLAAADADGVDAIWCLGDVVGYGPHPNECAALVRERADVCLVGNHDLAVLGEIDLELFVGHAGAAARWTRSVLADEHRDFLLGLGPALRLDGVRLAHGSPRDPVWEYVLAEPAAAAAFADTDEPLVLVGHSHVALRIGLHDGVLSGTGAAAGEEVDLAGGRHLLNPGSVGQPRDGDPRAAWLVIDTVAARATFRRTDYPVERTQAELREAGLPEVLAARLSHGA
ncbi:MAG TPA: metallophosphoesterase family protein [Gaiellaceae bacterium]|nr:metallophosphoesterase family protein [Gaiellaceae bacterium]